MWWGSIVRPFTPESSTMTHELSYIMLYYYNTKLPN
jgi:hypothetical protein